MKFALYCRELRGAGARAVGVGLLNSMARKDCRHQIDAYTPVDSAMQSASCAHLNIIPCAVQGGWRQTFAYNQFRAELKQRPVDAILMMGSRALVGAPAPQAVLCHNPWQVYPESAAWNRCSYGDYVYRSIRKAICGRSYRHAEVIAAQTPVMLKRLQQQYGLTDCQMALIPNSVTGVKIVDQSQSKFADRILETGHKVRAICLSRYYTHKNIDIFVQVADELLRRGRTDIGIFLTIDSRHKNGVDRVINAISKNDRQRIIHNLGEIPINDVPICYRAVNALILPSLLESFTNTYVDAMSAGVPILTSDFDFARRICGDAARYFNPQDPKSISDALESVTDMPEDWEMRIQKGKELIAKFPDWDRIAGRVIELLECVAQKRCVSHLASNIEDMN